MTREPIKAELVKRYTRGLPALVQWTLKVSRDDAGPGNMTGLNGLPMGIPHHDPETDRRNLSRTLADLNRERVALLSRPIAVNGF